MITGLSRWLNVLLILTTFVAYLSPYISPTTFWPVSIFGLAFPILFLLNFLFFLYWIFRRKKKARQVKEFENWLSVNKIDVFLLQETSKPNIKVINKILKLPHLFQPTGHASTRAGQSQKVLAHIRKSPYPVVVGGDFNEPPTSYVYQQFNTQLEDAFRTAGNGFGSTYGGKIPMLKIDYLFYDPHLRVLEHKIDRKSFSDHYPMRTRLAW